MAKVTLTSILIAAVVATGSVPALAGDITYQPRNPSFGGNPFYSQHLLGTAQAQDKYKDPSESADLGLSDLNDPGKEFERIIQSSLLARISSEISNQILAPESTGTGRFVIGNTQVDFSRNGGQTEVFITDIASGGRTRIELPTPTSQTQF